MDTPVAGIDWNQQTLVYGAILVAAGALLGGAVAHWRRGREMILTGAIIGAIVMPIAGLLFAIYLGVFVAVIAVAMVLGLAFSFFAG